MTDHMVHKAVRLFGLSRVVWLIVAVALAELALLTVADCGLALTDSVLPFVARGLFEVLFMDAMNHRI